MQTIDFLSTVSWIKSQYSGETINIFMEMGAMRLVAPQPPERQGRPPDLSGLLRAGHELANVRTKLESHPFAAAVLKAFGLDGLLDPEWAVGVVAALVGAYSGVGERAASDIGNLQIFAQNWENLLSCVEPIRELTTPAEVMEEEDFDEILTLEIRASDDATPTLTHISEVLLETQELYSALSGARKEEAPAPLHLIYAGSGSPLRFDFKGSGECIKELKTFFVDVWKAIRHRRADDLGANLEATMKSSAVLRQIQADAEKGALQPEEATAFRKVIVGSALALFRKGASIREIRAQETIENERLLEQIMQKALPAPPPGEGRKKPSKRSSKGRAKGKTKTDKSP